MIKIDFSLETKYGVFSDSIVYPIDFPISDSEIEAEKQRRLSNWINSIENPPVTGEE